MEEPNTLDAPTGNFFDDIVNLHKKYNFDHGGEPRFLSPADFKFRLKFMEEELHEYTEAVAIGDLATAADSLVDLVVVALGTAVMHGIPWNLLWDDVHRANMSKVRGITDRGVENDLQKPEGWVAPQSGALLDQFTEALRRLPGSWRPTNPTTNQFYASGAFER